MERAVVNAIIEEREKRKKSRQVKKMCKKILRFLLSTTGLLLVNAAVMIIGAYIFQHLEQGNEIAECFKKHSDYYIAENLTLVRLMELAQRVEQEVEEGQPIEEQQPDVKQHLQMYLKSFALSVLDTGYNLTRDCQLLKEDGEGSVWSLTSSLVFTLTVVTTIGMHTVCYSNCCTVGVIHYVI